MTTSAAEQVEERVALPGGQITILRPRDFEELLSEEAFEREELLPYWAHLWDSAVALAAEASRAVRPRTRVLELGCGLGLPSVAAARAGARVTASDWSPPALEATAQNAARAGVRVETVLCAWQRPEPIVSRAPFDLVLASDVLYERRQVGLLLGLLPRLVGIRGQVWIADPGRRPAERFLAQAAADWRRRSRRSPERPSVTVHRLRRRR